MDTKKRHFVVWCFCFTFHNNSRSLSIYYKPVPTFNWFIAGVVIIGSNILSACTK